MRKPGSQERVGSLPELALGDLTGDIIGAAIEVHRALGPGYLETIYEAALCVELARRGLGFRRQLSVPVLYRGIEVGNHRLDLFVEERVVVELKSAKQIEDIHFAIVKSYLRSMGREHGLIMNFAKTKLEVHRVLARTWHPSEPS